MLVLCRRNDSATCQTYLNPIAVSMNYVVTFAVQSFYCHRVWISTTFQWSSDVPTTTCSYGEKRSITIIIFLLAVLQFGTTFDVMRHGSIKFLDTTSLVSIASGVSAVCDTIITGTIFKCLWKSELRGRSHVIRDVVVFINTGALTCLISVIVGVVYLAQGNAYWVSAPAVLMSRFVICRTWPPSQIDVGVMDARLVACWSSNSPLVRPGSVTQSTIEFSVVCTAKKVEAVIDTLT
ncbi:hypothetical protein OG21DRAFT_1513782 [Imleria badia]|nr:hypothetical protein OG21DRAFT_1513782 [Imleria badia]